MSRARDDDAAFDRFVVDSAPGLLQAAYLIVRDLPVAEDLVQECLLRVAGRWPRVRRMEHPFAYARRVLVNLAVDEASRGRRRRRELAGFESALIDRGDASAGHRLDAVEDQMGLADALASLTARQRAVLMLRFYQDLTEAQVAEILGCSIGTVKSTTARSLDRLREQMASTSAASADR